MLQALCLPKMSLKLICCSGKPLRLPHPKRQPQGFAATCFGLKTGFPFYYLLFK